MTGNELVGQAGRRSAARRFLRSPSGRVGMTLALLLVAISLAAPVLVPLNPYQIDMYAVLQTPSREHWLGTDELGRDILSRLIYGGRNSLFVAVAVIGASVVIGTSVGITTAYYGGWVDMLPMRLVDLIMSFPTILLALLIISMLGPGLYQTIMAIGITYVPRFARLVRSSALVEKEKEYIVAAEALGLPSSRIICLHILPNILGPVVVQTTLLVGHAILVTASLGFLGLGVQPPKAEWGAMLSNARHFIYTSPHAVTVPGVAIFLAVMGFNLMGDALRDALDVQLT